MANPDTEAAIDWAAVRDEVVSHLQALIRLNTVNPPGNEIAVARYLEQTLRAEGIETEVVEPAPGKAVLRARIAASEPSADKPLLLLAHMDVVPVQADAWSVDPFGGEVRDGYLYGRGAIDDKGMLAVHLVTLLLLQRQVRAGTGSRLARDVALVATSDEETGGAYGIGWVATHRPDMLDASDAINEGGRVRVVNGRPLYVAVQCAEKVTHLVTVTTRGPTGHASVPLPDNAISRLGRALAAIGTHREPIVLIPTTTTFLAALATVWPEIAEAAAMVNVASGDTLSVAHGEEVLAELPAFDALLRAGVSATLLRAGTVGNVIPDEAQATLNVRTLPGQRLDDVLARLRRAVGDDQVEIVARSSSADAPATPHETPVFAALAASARALEPRIAVMPYLSTGATDSATLRRLGVRCYGVLPFPLEQEDESRMHGHDERVPVDALVWGTRLMWGAVARCVLGATE